MNKYAYVTLLNDDSYMDGLLGLYQSFENSKSPYPFVVIVTKSDDKGLSISDHNFLVLKKLGIDVQIRPEIKCSQTIRDFNKHYGLELWCKCFDKFHIFTLPYDRVIYLDADTYIFQNLDHLFEMEKESEVVCAIDPAVLFNLDFFKDYTIINAGVMLYTPSQNLFDELMRRFEEYDTAEEVKDIISDQFILDRYLIPRPLAAQDIIVLDSSYNIFTPYFEKYNIPIEDIRVMHFAGMKKPWLTSFEEVSNTYNIFIYRYLYELERFKRQNNIEDMIK